MKVNLFAPFAKVNTTDDGGREVWGFATLERVDKSGEIADFDGTLKAFQDWSSEIEKNTQGKSKGNVRVMHQPETGGMVIDWQPGATKIDESGQEKEVRGIWVGSYVPPHKTDVIADIDSGILSAYSIGGSYAKKWFDPEAGAKRFIPRMTELSLVDNPAVPGAEFQLIKSDSGPWMKKADDDLRANAEERAKKYGIAFKEGKGHLTPPKGYPTDEAEYGDPTNYAYPIDDSRVKAAVSYFNQEGQQEAGDYSEEEWAKIGHRIAAAASRLEGGEYTFKDGKIETPAQTSEGSEKSMNAEAIAKAALAAGINIEQMTAFMAELAKTEPNPKTVDGDGDGDKNKEFPNPDENAVDPAKAEEGAKENESGVGKDDDMGEVAKSVTGSFEHVQSMLRSAVNQGWNYRCLEATFPDHVIVKDWDNDKWYNVPYTLENGSIKLGEPVEVEQDFKPVAKSTFSSLLDLEPELAKAGATISEETRNKLHKAASHIHDTCKCEKCMKAASIYAGEEGTNNGEEPQEPPVKKGLTETDLQKAVGFSISEEIQKLGVAKQDDLAKFASTVDDLQKSMGAVAETLQKVNDVVSGVNAKVEDFSKSVDTRLKAIEDAPVSGGPLLLGATGQDAVPLQKSAFESEYEALNKAFEATTDPNIKDILGRKIATIEYKKSR